MGTSLSTASDYEKSKNSKIYFISYFLVVKELFDVFF